MAASTTAPILSPDDFASRLVALYPPWVGSDGRQQGGVAYALFKTLGIDLNLVSANFAYALAATRVATATGQALDAVAVDYLGSNFVRQPGETDTSFRPRIQASMLLPAVTRPAISQRIKAIANTSPRLLESFNGGDVGAFGMSYLGLDSTALPGRYGAGDKNFNWTGAADVYLTPSKATGLLPFFGYDFGTGFDQAQTTFIGGLGNAMILPLTIEYQVDQTIRDSIAAGANLKRRFMVPPTTNLTSTTATFAANSNSANADTPINPDLAAFESAFALFPAMPSWQAQIWIDTPGFSFKLGASAPAQSKQILSCLALSIFFPGVLPISLGSGFQRLVVKPPGFLASLIPLVTLGWNSTRWISNIVSDGFTLNFGAPSANGGAVAMALLADPIGFGGQSSVSAGAQSLSVSETGLLLPYSLFAIASWDTGFWAGAKTTSGFTINFANPAPAGGGTVWWWVEEGI